MRQTHHPRYLTPLAFAAGVALVCAMMWPASALAWGNGPSRGNGFGTHDWILTEANRMAATQGATWVNASVALPVTDDPDTVYRNFKSHSYDRWGKKYGNADARVGAVYSQAVAALAAGDVNGASRLVGILSHYYADVCDPLNTDEVAAEKKMRAKYDSSVDKKLKRPGAYSWWVSYDGYRHVTSASALTVSSARSAHGSYKTLVSRYGRKGSGKTVDRITASSLNRATNGMADIIVSIAEDAALRESSQTLGAHQGVATDGDEYWVFHTSWIQRYDASWRSLATTAGVWASKDTTVGPFAGLDGFVINWLTQVSEAHLGAGTRYNGKLYVPAENWPSVSNQQIMVFDAKTLTRERSVLTSQSHEVAAVAVVSDEGTAGVLYVASYLDSSRLFKYDLEGLKYMGSLPLDPPPSVGIQGLTYHDGTFFIGIGRTSNLGRVYTADRSGHTRLIYTSTLPGIHEGFDFRGERLIWLIDHGASDSRVHSFRLPGF